MSANRFGAVVWLALLCAGCSPDVTLKCLASVPAIDDTAVSDPAAFCARCFEALGYEGAADTVPSCPTGMTGSCRADVAAREYCCEGDCITCP